MSDELFTPKQVKGLCEVAYFEGAKHAFEDAASLADKVGARQYEQRATRGNDELTLADMDGCKLADSLRQLAAEAGK